MDTLLFVVIVIIGIAIFLVLLKAKHGSRNYPYHLSKYLMSKAELSFYGVLVHVVGDSGIVFSKVRVADVIYPMKGLNRSEWQRAFNAISSKHFDFIVCDPANCSIKLAVELDDSSHGSSKAQRRDDLLNGACQSAGLPLLRIKAARSYVVAELKRQVEEVTSLQPVVPEESAILATVDPPAQFGMSEGAITPSAVSGPGPSKGKAPVSVDAQDGKAKSQTCPKCGEVMVLRKAKSGASAGQEFWGCSAFPKCRTVMPAGA